MKYIFLIITSICFLNSKAQSLDHENWKLSKKTNMDSVETTDVKDFPYHYLFYKENHQIYIDKTSNSAKVYIAKHVRVHINSKKGMEKFSRISQSGTDELFQYRIIKKDGEIIDKVKKEESNSSDISSLFSDPRFSFLSYYLSNEIEGLDSNCELEYIYVTKVNTIRNQDLYGAYFIQEDVPINNFEYNIISPDFLQFRMVGLNGCPTSEEDESDDKNYQTITISKVPAFYKSAITAINANKVSFLFKLYKNTNMSKTEEIMQFSSEAKGVFDVYMNTSKDDLSAIKKYTNKKESLTNKSGLERIKNLEYALKEDFESAYSAGTIKAAMKEKRADNRTLIKLFCGALNLYNEEYELVYATNRRYLAFNDEYDNYVYLDDLLIYLPKYDAYIDPTSRTRYLNLMFSSLRENRALFIKKIGVGDFSSAKNYVDSIPALDYKLNSIEQQIDIAINSTNTTEVKVTESYGGIEAISYWNTLKDIDFESEEDFFNGLCKYKFNDAVLKEGNLADVDNKKSPLDVPVKYDYTFTSDNLVVQNNNKISVKIGSMINDSKAIQEKPKGNYAPDVYNGYQKTKQIAINIPSGYKLSNANELALAKKYKSGEDKDALVFEIAHKIEGNKLIITYTEVMNRGKFNVADMDNFLEVYNAGFNLKDLTVEFVKI